jgi:hypothetical protein
MKSYAINVTNESPWAIMPETYIVELNSSSSGTSKNNILEHEEF